MEQNNPSFALSLSHDSQALIRSGNRRGGLRKSYLRWLEKSGYLLNPHAEEILAAFSGLLVAQPSEKNLIGCQLVIGERGGYDKLKHTIQLYGPFLWQWKLGEIVNKVSNHVIQESVCLVGQLLNDSSIYALVFVSASARVLTIDRFCESFMLSLSFDSFLLELLGKSEPQWLDVDTQEGEMSEWCEAIEYLMPRH